MLNPVPLIGSLEGCGGHVKLILSQVKMDQGQEQVLGL